MNLKSNQAKTITVSSLLFLFICLIGCTSSKTSVQNKSLEKKYESALKNLQKGKAVEKNKATLVASLNELLSTQSIISDSLIKYDQMEMKEKGYEINSSLYKKLEESQQFTDSKFDVEMASIKNENLKLDGIFNPYFLNKGKETFSEAKEKDDKYLSRDAYESLMKSKKYGNEEVDGLIKESLDFSYLVYKVEAKDLENTSYKSMIDDQFKELQNLELFLTKVFYKKKDNTPCDCQVEILFDRLITNDSEDGSTQEFTKQVQEQIQKSDGSTGVTTITVRGSVTQRIKRRNLDWAVRINITPNGNNCKLKNKSYAKKLVSESITINTSGDHRAIPEKYTNAIEEPLLNKTEMAEEVINRVFEDVKNEFKNSN